MEIVSETAV